MFQRPTLIVQNILIINVLFFLAKSVSPVFDELMTGFYPLSAEFKPWQVITHMFMHADIRHIFFNMIGVYFLGPMLENRWGPKRFLIYYMVTGIGAFALHYLTVYIEMRPLMSLLTESQMQEIYLEGRQVILDGMAYTNPTINGYNNLLNGGVVGASGALFGIIFAFGYLFPNTRLMLLFPPIPIKAKWFAIGLAVIELYMIRSAAPNDNVAHYAHLGGMLVGFLVLKFWQRDRSRFY